MPKFAANLSTMFNEHDFPDRPDAAGACGFVAAECQFPYATPAEVLRQRLDAAGLELVLLNAPAGDLAAGDRGLGSVEGRDEEFRASIETAGRYAEVVGCPRVHVMAGCPSDSGASNWMQEPLSPTAIIASRTPCSSLVS